jgi:major membrane immunogen (membrane-anchored lipoprotein)
MKKNHFPRAHTRALPRAPRPFGQVKAKDGLYFAQESEYAKESGWKDQVVVTVKGGKIADVYWNGVSNTGAADKRTAVAAGGYDMVKYRQGQGRVGRPGQGRRGRDRQGPGNFQVRAQADGTTDAISGASIHVAGLFELVNKALAAPAVPKGIYAKSGWFFKEQADFDKQTTWKDSVLVTVVNGTVVDVIWNGVSSDKTKKSKLVEDLAGKYGMEKAAKKGAWNVQAKAVQDAIVKVQDPPRSPSRPTARPTPSPAHPSTPRRSASPSKPSRPLANPVPFPIKRPCGMIRAALLIRTRPARPG